MSAAPISGLTSAASAPVQPCRRRSSPVAGAGCGCVLLSSCRRMRRSASPGIDGAVGSAIGSRAAAADGSVAIVAITPLDAVPMVDEILSSAPGEIPESEPDEMPSASVPETGRSAVWSPAGGPRERSA